MDTTQAELDRLVEGGLPGAFVYVEDADGESRFWTAGVADLESGTPMTPTSYYRIGSTTKTFTAVVVLQLIGEGRLAVDDLVQAWLPDLSIPNGDRLTIEHLLRMRSGLFDFEDDPSLLGNLEAHLRPVSLARVNELAVRGRTKFLPGERFEYCNSNFCLLEAIVERVTGRGLGEEMRQRIFELLGLRQTTWMGEGRPKGGHALAIIPGRTHQWLGGAMSASVDVRAAALRTGGEPEFIAPTPMANQGFRVAVALGRRAINSSVHSRSRSRCTAKCSAAPLRIHQAASSLGSRNAYHSSIIRDLAACAWSQATSQGWPAMPSSRSAFSASMSTSWPS
jgi:CubicO group peptidase (beta-lactamase class C family)